MPAHADGSGRLTAELWALASDQKCLLVTLPVEIEECHGGSYIRASCRHHVGVVPDGVRHAWVICYDGVPVDHLLLRAFILAPGSGGGIARDLPCIAQWALYTSSAEWRARVASWRERADADS